MRFTISAVRAGVLGVCMAAGAVPMLAQQQDTPETGHRRFAGPGKMWEDLNLTPDQKQQMHAIHKDGMQKMMAIHEEETSKIRAILNDEQRAKFDASQARMKDRMGKRHHRQDAEPMQQQ